MINNIIGFIAPHHCCGCDRIGTLLCDDCKNNIIDEMSTVCLVCRQPTSSSCLCDSCRVPYEKAWVVGERSGVLQRLIGLYKFERAKSGYKDLGGLLSAALPQLPPQTVIVPVPTTSGRIRERGYDHMLLIARFLARLRGLECKALILRKNNTKQRQASLQQRQRQASEAFTVDSVLDGDTPYLLIDDVFTTGATVKYAAQALVDAGARHVWVAIIARQTLD